MEYIATRQTGLLDFMIGENIGGSRNKAKSLLTRGLVTVNGIRVTRHDHPLRINDIVCLSEKPPYALLKNPLISILHEDEHLIVVQKKEGLLSVAIGKENHRTAFRIISDHVKLSNPQARIFIVHRLDRETSGIMIFAKSQSIQTALQENWKELVRERSYTAVLDGRLGKTEGTVDVPLSENHNLKVFAMVNGEKKAATDFKVLKSNAQYTLVELSLRTGRKNQIRAHMEYIGHPVAGDKKYGSRTDPASRVCLHAGKLEFIHPATDGLMSFSTPAPSSFTKLFK